ncbi:MAG: GNAT family N-acetyltransferase [Acidobacteriota bacterium]|nr:MAG: GNAT family N-acetyltransferase [Acidobacteriota bacterium]
MTSSIASTPAGTTASAISSVSETSPFGRIGRLTVERSALPALRDVWRELITRARTRNIFVDWEFISTWWDHFRGDRAGRVYTVQDERGRVVAIVPLYVETTRLRFGCVRVLRNVGHGDVINPDFLDALVVPGLEPMVARALAPYLIADAEWEYARWSDLVDDGSLVRIARELDRVTELELQKEQRSLCPYVSLPQEFDQYLATCSSTFRHKIRQRSRKIERDLKVSWQRVGGDIGVSTGIALLTRLHQQRMESTGRGGNFRKGRYREFHRELSERLARRGKLFFWVLFTEGQPFASEYGYLDRGVFYGYQMGFDPRYRSWSPGTYMMAVTMRKLIEEEGAHEMNFLRGTDDWKFRWTDEARPTVSLTLTRPGWRSHLARLRAGLSGPPALVLRFLIGRDSFNELRSTMRRFRRQLRRSV